MKSYSFSISFIFTLCFSFFFFFQSYGQPNQVREFYFDTVNIESDSLKNEFSVNKTIPVLYELEILKALSYYPELMDVEIQFKVQKIKTTLNTRPKLGSLLFRRKSKRKYVIRIDESTAPEKVTLREANFNAKIGVFGHEFYHIIDYSKKGFFGVFARGLAYGSNKSKEKFEKEIDSNTIKRGLGWQLYEWSNYVLNESNGTEKYKTFKRKIYLEPNEIKNELLK